MELDIEELNDHSYHRKKSTWQLLKSFLNCETCSINLAVTYLFFHNKYTLSNRDKDCIVILFYNCPEIALNVAGTI